MSNRQKRIVGVPKFSLETLLPSAQKIFEAMHLEPCSRDTIAEVLGVSPKSGAFGSKLGALLSFGLLESSRGTYSVSEEAGNYFLPIDDKSQGKAIVHFVLCPDFYRVIHDRFCEKPLPVALQNIIAQDMGIPSVRAKEYAEAIQTNFEFAGLIRNGVVQTADGATSSNETGPGGCGEETGSKLPPKNLVPNHSGLSTKDVKRATLPLDDTDGLVVVEWPKDISKEDYADISDWIDILKRKIERSIVTEVKNESPTDE